LTGAAGVKGGIYLLIHELIKREQEEEGLNRGTEKKLPPLPPVPPAYADTSFVIRRTTYGI